MILTCCFTSVLLASSSLLGKGSGGGLRPSCSSSSCCCNGWRFSTWFIVIVLTVWLNGGDYNNNNCIAVVVGVEGSIAAATPNSYHSATRAVATFERQQRRLGEFFTKKDKRTTKRKNPITLLLPWMKRHHPIEKRSSLSLERMLGSSSSYLSHHQNQWRGGAGATTPTPMTSARDDDATDDDENDNEADKEEEEQQEKKQQQQQEEEKQKDLAMIRRNYQLQQHLLLQSQSVLLRQALIDRGLDGLQFLDANQIRSDNNYGDDDDDDSAIVVPAKPVDWECALATEQEPKSCLFSLDAQLGTKVIAPRHESSSSSFSSTDNNNNQLQWITLSSLNRLRREDPTKVDPLWHSRHAVLSTWFDTTATSPYSLYGYLNPKAALLSAILDCHVLWTSPLILTLITGSFMTLLLFITIPFWEPMMTQFLISSFLWKNWSSWARFTRAAFPLKLLVAQYIWKVVAHGMNQLQSHVYANLVTWEGHLWEDCIPRTILEEHEKMDWTSQEQNDDDDEEDDEDDEDDDDEDDFVDLR